MPLILTKEEIEAVKRGLECLIYKSSSSTAAAKANSLQKLLNENEDCTVWVVMTEEDREEWSRKYGETE